jgi:hypothetical protein
VSSHFSYILMHAVHFSLTQGCTRLCFFLSMWTEKKLLHSKLRNIPVNENVNIIEKSSDDKRDVSTATEDLGDY